MYRLSIPQQEVLNEMERGIALVQIDSPLVSGRVQTVYFFDGGVRVKPQIIRILEREGFIHQIEEDGRIVYRSCADRV